MATVFPSNNISGSNDRLPSEVCESQGSNCNADVGNSLQSEAPHDDAPGECRSDDSIDDKHEDQQNGTLRPSRSPNGSQGSFPHDLKWLAAVFFWLSLGPPRPEGHSRDGRPTLRPKRYTTQLCEA